MAKKRPITPKKLLVRVLIVLGVLVASILFLFLYEGSTKPILSVADKFQPDPSWELVGESVEPPRIMCMSGSCPEVVRSWERSKSLTCLELEVYVRHSWDLSMEQDCSTGKNKFGNLASSYSAIGPIENGDYYIYVLGKPAGDNKKSTIFLSLRKN